MNQAKAEFTSRGLIVHTVNSKDELLRNFRLRRLLLPYQLLVIIILRIQIFVFVRYTIQSMYYF